MEILETLLALASLYEFFAFGIVVVWNLIANIKSTQMKNVVSYGLVVLFVQFIMNFIDETKSLEEEILSGGISETAYSFLAYFRYSIGFVVVFAMCAYISYSIYQEIKER